MYILVLLAETSYSRTTLGCLSSFSVAISLFICSSIFMARMRCRSRILMAKARPVSACRASLTLPKWPSPSVRPISYFPMRIAPAPAVAALGSGGALSPGTNGGAGSRCVEGSTARARWTRG
uniref:Uncharacterized protein n=1 Tax=Arundo donax TaxID=35708 RepID=A0A0A9CEQ0_ARUDO